MPWYLWVLVALGYVVAFVVGRSAKHTKLESALFELDDAMYHIRKRHVAVANKSGILWCETCSTIGPCATYKLATPSPTVDVAFDD